MKTPIYMDHHSTTPVDPGVLDAMLPYLRERFGNAASHGHAAGREAREALEAARAKIARAVGAKPGEIVFTSGATESNNLALLGGARALAARGDHIVSATTEHRSVLDPLDILEGEGCVVARVAVDHDGRVDPADVERAITSRTILVSVMAANNEVGTVARVADIGEVARRRGITFHTDAVQALGRVPLDVERMSVDMMSLSAHKIYGPKGVGALYVRKDPAVAIRPILVGGGHERGLRSGTPNVPGAVGFGCAVDIACEVMADETARLSLLRDRLLAVLQDGLDGVEVNGHPTERLAGSLNVSFERIDGEALLVALEEIAFSTGSACMSDSREPSHVLGAMGRDADRIRGSVRFGLGRFNTADEADYVGSRVVEEVSRLRGLAPDTAGV